MSVGGDDALAVRVKDTAGAEADFVTLRGQGKGNTPGLAGTCSRGNETAGGDADGAAEAGDAGAAGSGVSVGGIVCCRWPIGMPHSSPLSLSGSVTVLTRWRLRRRWERSRILVPLALPVSMDSKGISSGTRFSETRMNCDVKGARSEREL